MLQPTQESLAEPPYSSTNLQLNLKGCLSSAQISNAATPPILPIFQGIPLQFFLFGPAELRTFISDRTRMPLSLNYS